MDFAYAVWIFNHFSTKESACFAESAPLLARAPTALKSSFKIKETRKDVDGVRQQAAQCERSTHTQKSLECTVQAVKVNQPTTDEFTFSAGESVINQLTFFIGYYVVRSLKRLITILSNLKWMGTIRGYK